MLAGGVRPDGEGCDVLCLAAAQTRFAAAVMDRAYDPHHGHVATVVEQNREAVIPAQKNRKEAIPHDKEHN